MGLRGFLEVKAPRFRDMALVSHKHRPSLPPGVSWYSFLEAENNPEHMELSDATEKFPGDTTGDRSRDLPTSSAVPKPLRHPRLCFEVAV
jgi:hypothetical protein